MKFASLSGRSHDFLEMRFYIIVFFSPSEDGKSVKEGSAMLPNPLLHYALLQNELLIQEYKFSGNFYADYSHRTCSLTPGCFLC